MNANAFIILALSGMENEEDKNFIADIYINYGKLMKFMAFKFVDNSYDADDIVQDVCVKLINKIPLLKTFTIQVLLNYVVFAIENSAIDFLRKRKRHLNLHQYFGDDDIVMQIVQEIPDFVTTENIVIENYDKEIIHKAVKRLNPKQKFVINCKYFHNMSDNEIAAVLEIKPVTVRGYLTDARKTLQKILTKEYDISGVR